MPDPFRVTGPGVISFSGGRTSAYMLWRVLDAHDGKLPADVVVAFANTGREMPGTLDFVQACGDNWGVNIAWLEYRRDPETGHVWTETVNHNSASRNGEPFRALLVERQMLPNPVMRFCTTELKIRVAKRWVITELGWQRWVNFVGLRYDELHRVVKKGIENARRKERFRVSCPLAKARITKAGHVLPFWREQPFDLMLNGAWEGNCDGCFLKNRSAKRRMIADHPERMEEWAWDEENAAHKGTRDPSVAQYRSDITYRALINQVRDNPRIPGLDPDDSGFDVFADCEGGCGI